MDFKATITATGELKLDDKARFKRALSRLAGRRVVVRIVGEERQRSLAQNAYLHGVLIPALQQAWSFERSKTGTLPLSLEQAKVVFKLVFIGSVQTAWGPVPRKGTSECTTKELSKAIDEARAYARETWAMNIPAPNEPWEPINGEGA